MRLSDYQMLPKCNILCKDDSENNIRGHWNQKTPLVRVYMAPLFRETNNADIALLYTFLMYATATMSKTI